MKSAVRRAAVIGAGVMVPLALATPALAHVTVSSTSAVQGGYAKLTFRMPNEEDNANTVKLDVQLPSATPFASVSVKPHAGWSFQVIKSKLATPLTDDDGNKITEAVSEIIWTASADAALKPGTFDEFDISVGPLPKVDSIQFKALQTYSNGDVVRWIEVPTPGSKEEPEHPAPTLKLTAASSSDDSMHMSGATATASPAATVTADAADSMSDSDGTARTLGIVGIVVGVVGVGAGIFASRRRAS